MIEKIKKNYLYILEYLVLLTFSLSVALANNMEFVGKVNKYFILNIILVIIISLFFFLLFIKKKELKLERVFLLIILIIGPVYLIFFPINSLPDDATHSFRIYEISTGNIISKKFDKVVSGRKMDKNLSEAVYNNKTYDDYIANLDVKPTKSKKIYNFNNTALYSFICYLPQVIGVLFAKIFTSSITIQLLFARIFNFICYVILIYFAIKVLPIKKELLLLVGLLPLSIQEAVSFSPDSLTIAATSLLISYIVYLKSSKIKKINKNNIIILALLSLIVSQCKIVYLPLCVLTLLIPSNKFKSVKEKYLVLISIIIIISIISLGWLKIAGQFLPEGANNINSSKQLENILHNPFKYIYILLYTFNSRIVDFIFQAFGSNLGTLNISVPSILIFINIILFIILAICNYKEKERLSKINKWYIILVVIGVVLLMCTSLYIQWTPVGNKVIEGIQGRYLIPVLFLSGLILYNTKINTKINLVNKYLQMFIVMEHLTIISCIIYHFI